MARDKQRSGRHRKSTTVGRRTDKVDPWRTAAALLGLGTPVRDQPRVLREVATFDTSARVEVLCAVAAHASKRRGDVKFVLRSRRVFEELADGVAPRGFDHRHLAPAVQGVLRDAARLEEVDRDELRSLIERLAGDDRVGALVRHAFRATPPWVDTPNMTVGDVAEMAAAVDELSDGGWQILAALMVDSPGETWATLAAAARALDTGPR